MIAICQPTPAEWNGGPPVAQRTGSLRRIDDILSELLAGYAEPVTGYAEPTAACAGPSAAYAGPAVCDVESSGYVRAASFARAVQAGGATETRRARAPVPGAAVDSAAHASPAELLSVCQQ